jgi:hypothetical protein
LQASSYSDEVGAVECLDETAQPEGPSDLPIGKKADPGQTAEAVAKFADGGADMGSVSLQASNPVPRS